MRWFLALTLAAGALLCAQEKPPAQTGPAVVHVVPVNNANVHDIAQAIGKLGAPGVTMTTFRNNIVVSGSPVFVQAVEDAIHKLDVPAPAKKDIELIGYMLLASRAPAEAAAAFPADLERAVSQFKTLLAYKSFRLLDSIQVRAREGSGINTGGILSLSPARNPMNYEFHVGRAELAGGTIHLNSMFLRLAGASIGTDVDIQPNQKVAVGKASVDPNGDALILVISAKVVD